MTEDEDKAVVADGGRDVSAAAAAARKRARGRRQRAEDDGVTVGQIQTYDIAAGDQDQECRALVIFTARCYAERGYEIACRPSVPPFVRDV